MEEAGEVPTDMSRVNGHHLTSMYCCIIQSAVLIWQGSYCASDVSTDSYGNISQPFSSHPPMCKMGDRTARYVT